ncbi:MAG: hypothetical protein MJE77_34005 [Proteobacteria bacterium]|nr:hypothetical protein [Pseudomonadota bacterium]
MRSRPTATTSTQLSACCAAAFIGLLLFIGAARAESDGKTEVDAPMARGPWSAGVSIETQYKARALFDQGNVLMQTASPTRAAAKYKQALALWNHPVIHFNLGMAQRLLDQLVEARESLQNSMRYGAAPIGRQKYLHARKILALVESQLGHIEVTCSEPGARVTLDGKLLFVAPGRASQFVRAAEHQIIASKKGRETYQASIKLAPGDRKRFEPVLPEIGRVHTERYMPAWVPWASLAGAAATLGGAAYMDRRAERAMERFDVDFNNNPRCRARGCFGHEQREQADQFERADLQRKIATSMYIVGSTALVGSAVLLYLNRERVTSRPERTHVESENAVVISPMTTKGYPVGIQARLRF